MIRLSYIFILLISFQITAQENLAAAMQRLETTTILVVNSQQLDNYPIWAPDSDAIAYNINDKWYKIDLNNLSCETVKWRGQIIGYVKPNDLVTELTQAEIMQYQQVSKFNARESLTKNGTKISLPMQDLRTSLVVQQKNGPAKTLWTSGGENCHSLVLSPDQNYVAYLCELNGLLIMKIN